MAIQVHAIIMVWLNSFTFNMASICLVTASIPFLTVGIPGLIITNTHFFDYEEEKGETNQAAGAAPDTAQEPKSANKGEQGIITGIVSIAGLAPCAGTMCVMVTATLRLV